jgi:hypothetical protein
MNPLIRYCSLNDELDFFVNEDWAIVCLAMPDKTTKRQAIEWLEHYSNDRVVIYNGGQRPNLNEVRWGPTMLGDGTMYYFFFENPKTATMFKVANGV